MINAVFHQFEEKKTMMLNHLHIFTFNTANLTRIFLLLSNANVMWRDYKNIIANDISENSHKCSLNGLKA